MRGRLGIFRRNNSHNTESVLVDKMKQIVFVICVLFINAAAGVCPKGWVEHPGFGKCYFFSENLYIFSTARSLCESRNAQLVSFNSVAERDFIHDIVASRGNQFWLGAQRANKNAPFLWLDGSSPPPTDQNIRSWDNNEPSTADGDDCIWLNWWNKKWQAKSCWAIKPYICKRSNEMTDPCNFEDDWHHIENRCFKYFQDRLSWSSARAQCQSSDGDLAVLNDTAKINVFQEVVNCKDYRSNVWMGLSDTSSPGQLKWVNNQLVGSQNKWAPNQPDMSISATQKCAAAVTSNSYQWALEDCATEEQYVCEKPQGTCAAGWRELGGLCYGVVTADRQATHSDASLYCKGLGAQLAVINSQSRQNDLVQLLNAIQGQDIPQLRIGLSDSKIDNQLVWDNGAPLVFANWGSSGATLTPGRWDCAYIDTSDPQAVWQSGYCFSKMSFVCQMPMHGIVQNMTDQYYCSDSGWTVSKDKCYQQVDSDVSWDTANMNCTSKQARLVNVLDENVQSFVSGNLRGPTWSGLKYSGGVWIWTDSTQPVFRNWAPNQPGSSQGCASFDPAPDTAGQWKAQSCSATNKYICMKDAIHNLAPTTPPVPTPRWSSRCGVGWYLHAINGFCYQVNPSPRKSWSDAQAACQQQGANLASIATLEEQGYVTGLLAMQTVNMVYWIGLNALDPEYGWTWSDGSGVGFLYWQGGEPNNYRGNEWCVEIGMNKEGRWNDHVCAVPYGYICKKQAAGNNPPTPTTEPEPSCGGNTAMIDGAHHIMSKYLTASSQKGGSEASRARINANSCWSPTTNANTQYIQADFSYPILVKRVSTKGAPDRDEWVTSYRIVYLYDANDRDNVYTSADGTPMDFTGNGDRWTEVIHDIDRPFLARFVKFVPQGWETAISMRIEVYGCKAEDCPAENLISGDVKTSATRLTASSGTNGHQASNARFSEIGDGQKQPGWAPSSTNNQQWIQAELDTSLRIRYIVTAGRSDATAYVKKYKLRYSDDGSSWTTYQEQKGTDKVFDGNRDDRNKVTNELLSPIDAKFVRINPLEWEGSIGLRFEVMGCGPTCGGVPLITGPRYQVHDSQMTASSSFDPRHNPARSRLRMPFGPNSAGAWCSATRDQNQWIQVDFRVTMHVTGIATQGRMGAYRQWVTGYWLLYGDDGNTWQYYKEAGDTKMFKGNWDQNTVSKHYLKTPFNGRFVRLWVREYNDNPSMRWEIYGCQGPRTSKDLGCYVDHRADLDLPYAPWSSAPGGMTREVCVRHCFASSYMYAGVQNGRFCYCGNTYGRYGLSYNCAVKCQGRPSEACGGPESNWIMSTGLGPVNDRCRTGWITGPDNKCYLFYKEWLTWDEASKYCQNQGAQLATINSRKMQAFMEGQLAILQRDVWIGLHCFRRQLFFEWVSGEPILFTNWGRGGTGRDTYLEPNNWHNTDEDCVLVFFSNGKWNDETCAFKKGAVCQMEKQVLPAPPTQQPDPGCGPDWVPFRWKCYHVNRAPRWRDWHRDTCQSTGGILARIQDRFEQAFVTTLLGDDNYTYFLDIHDRKERGFFQFSDGRSIPYTHWDVGMPRALGTASCVYMAGGTKYGAWGNVGCGTRIGGLCEKNSSTVTPPTGPTQPPSGACPIGWQTYMAFCYEFNARTDATQQLQWDDARSDCQDKGADLVSIHSAEENDWIFRTNLIGSGGMFWNGLIQRSGESGFKWADGSSAGYFNWAPGQPGNINNADICVDIRMDSGLWQTTRCNSPHNWICKARPRDIVSRTTPVYPPPAPAGNCAPWEKFNNRCYYVSQLTDGTLSWQQSRAACLAKGAELASFHSQSEMLFVQGMLIRNSVFASEVWTGLTTLIDGSWRWSDGTATDFVNWADGAPSSSGFLGCVKMPSSKSLEWGKLRDDHCGVPKRYVCVKGNTTPTPPPPPRGNCPSGWIQSALKCYQMFMDRVNWTQAETRCETLGQGGTLATINNRLEQAYVTKELINKTNMWIGFRRQAYGGDRRFLWKDNSDATYTNWARGEPNGQDREECGMMYYISNRAGRWNDAPCRVVNGYLCQTPKDPSIPNPPPTQGTCSAGWSWWNGDCYKLVSSQTSWQAADSACSPGHLTSVLSVYEQAYVETLVGASKVHTWIGLSDQSNPGLYHWQDGWTMLFSNWGQNQPSLPAAVGGCVVLNATDKAWYDVNCAGSYPSICKQSTKVPPVTRPPPGTAMCPPDNSNDHWTQFNGYCYLFKPNAQLTFANARFECNSRYQADIVSIHSQAESQFILRNIAHGQGRQWIGLFRMSETGFAWLDRTPVDFTKWNKNEPNNAGGIEDCVEIYEAQGVWNDIKCNNLNGYICKTKAVYPVTPRPIRTLPPWTGSGTRPPITTPPVTYPPWTGSGTPPTDWPVPPTTTAGPQRLTGMSGATKAGVAIGVILIAAALLGGGLFLFKFRGAQNFRRKLEGFGFSNPGYGRGGGGDRVEFGAGQVNMGESTS